LNRLKDGRFLAYTHSDGLADDVVRSIFQDRQGAVWIATRGGLSRFESGHFASYHSSDGLANDSVLSVFQDTDGAIWAGTRGGLSRFNGSRFVSYKMTDGSGDLRVLAMHQDISGALWIGTGSGLLVFKDGQFSPYTVGGLDQDAVYAISEDRDGAVWLGTDGSGLKHLKGGVLTAYTTRDGLSNDIVMAIHRDDQGVMWIGTNSGLTRYADGRFTTYTTHNGLYDDTIFQVLEDSAGCLWMSCNKGIFRVNKQELNDFASGKTSSVLSVSYGVADGMKSRECQGGFQSAGCRTIDGRLWFPTIKGVAIVDPASLQNNPLAPPVVIEQVVADNQQIRQELAELGPGNKKIEFHFSGLSLIVPEKVKFKYMLEGFDRDWVDAGSKREAFYTNIPAGRYTFRVIASNNDWRS